MKRFLLILPIFFLWFPNISYAAIAVDSTSQASSAGSVNSLTWSHTITGSNVTLIVLFGENTGTPSQSSVTWNGTAMTPLTTVSTPFANNKIGWYLTNAATGTHNIVATRTTTSTATIRGAAVDYTGTSSVQPDAQNTWSVPSANSGAISITPVASGTWHIATYNNDNSGAVSAGTNTTLRIANAGDSSMAILDSNGTITAGSPHSLNFTTTNVGSNYGNTFSIAPYVAPTVSSILASILAVRWW